MSWWGGENSVQYLFDGPELGISRSITCILVMLNKIWNSEREKSCFMALVSSEICVILIYGLSICGTRDSQNRLPGSKVKIYIYMGQLLARVPSAKMSV